MIIELDLNQYKDSDLTLVEFIYLTFMYKHNPGTDLFLSNFINNFSERENLDLKSLKDKGYLNKEGKLTSKYLNNFVGDLENKWLEFKNSYPTKTPNKERQLRGNLKKNKAKYIKLIKDNPSLHKTILESLKWYLENTPIKQKNYMRMMETWLNKEEWKVIQKDMVRQQQSEPAQFDDQMELL